MTLQEIIDNSNKIVFFGGAGVSTESGIPDFRSADGIYNDKTFEEEFGADPEYLLSSFALYGSTEKFYKFHRSLILSPNNGPNIAHNKLYKDLLEISPSEIIKGLNTNQLTVNLSPETPYIYLGTKFNDKKDGLGLEIFPKSKASYFGIFRNGKRVEAGKFKIKNDIKDYSYYGNIYGIYAWGFGWLINNKSKKYYE